MGDLEENVCVGYCMMGGLYGKGNRGGGVVGVGFPIFESLPKISYRTVVWDAMLVLSLSKVAA